MGPAGSGRQHLAAAIHYAGVSSPPLAASQAAEVVGQLAGPGVLAVGLPVAGRRLHRRGAGGRGPRRSACSLDATGTLLLHRVDELPAKVQLQLVDLLARRLAQWRLIATAATPLGDLAQRAFQAELAAQLSTITIELPPLSARRDNLPLLAQLFLEERNAAGPRQIGGFSQRRSTASTPTAGRATSTSWPPWWPRHRRERAGRQIGEEDLPERLRLAAQAAAHPRRAEETIVLDEYIGRVERELIRRALARSNGNKARAARLLGVTRPRLYRRMVLLGLEEGRGERGEGRGKSGE